MTVKVKIPTWTIYWGKTDVRWNLVWSLVYYADKSAFRVDAWSVVGSRLVTINNSYVGIHDSHTREVSMGYHEKQ